MSDAITITCPHCKSSLKLKNSNSVGKKVPCPKCKKPFIAKAPEEDDLAFLNASESDGAVPMEDEEEDEFAAAPPTKSKARSAGGTSKKGKRQASSGGNWVKPLLIGTAALVVLALLIGGGLVAVSMIGGQVQNKIDLTYLPSDADAVMHVRVAEVLGSPFLQPLVAKPEVKQFLDKFASEAHVPLADVKSITIGAHAPSAAELSKLMQPGFGAAGPQSALAACSPWVVVVRTSRDLPSDLLSKFQGLQATDYGGKTYFRPAAGGSSNEPCVFQPVPQVLVIADATQMQRMIDEGLKQKRRPEFDFVDDKPQILLVRINKPVAPGAPPVASTATPGAGPGAPGGIPQGTPGLGTSDLPATVQTNTKATCTGISFTNDIEFQEIYHSPDASGIVRSEMEQYIANKQAEFQRMKPQMAPMLELMGLGDMVVQLDAAINSVKVSEAGSKVLVTAKVPGAIRASLEKGLAMMSNMAAGALGGLGGEDLPQAGQPPPGVGDPGSLGNIPEGAAPGNSDSSGVPQ